MTKKETYTNFKTLLVNILSQNGYTNGKDYKIRYFKSSPYRANRGEKNVQECWLTVRNAPTNVPIAENDFDDIESLTNYVCGLVDSKWSSKKKSKQTTTLNVGDLISYKGVEESVFKIVGFKGNNYVVVELGDRTRTKNEIPFADKDKLQRAVSPLLITEAKLAKNNLQSFETKLFEHILKSEKEEAKRFIAFLTKEKYFTDFKINILQHFASMCFDFKMSLKRIGQWNDDYENKYKKYREYRDNLWDLALQFRHYNGLQGISGIKHKITNTTVSPIIIAEAKLAKNNKEVKIGDEFIKPKEWELPNAWLSDNIKDKYDLFYVSYVHPDGIIFLYDEQSGKTERYTQSEFYQLGLQFYKHYSKDNGISGTSENLSGILKPVYYDFDNEDDGNDYGKSRTATKELLKDVKAFAKRLKTDLGLEDYYHKNKNRTVETNHTECNVHFVVPQAKAPENHLHIKFYVNHPLRGVNYDYQLDEWFPISLGEEHSFGDTYRCSINQTYDEILRDIRIHYPIFRIKKASSGNAEMQSAEYEIVLQAREIAQNGESLRQRFDRLVDLYNNQRTIKPTDTKSKLLQQYSTPCPLAFLASEYVKQNAAERYYIEPSAGNGMLTISLPVNHTVVNEIDEVRLENLKKQGFADCMSKDASKPICAPHLFDGVITNPPFKSLPEEEQITENGFTLATLDYKMACAALAMMRNDGRAAVIVGGKMFDNYWKPLKNTDKNVLFGQWKIFLGWLYAAYNVEDLIYIGGDYIYRKQGTTYPVVLILIDGRRVPFSTKNKPDYVYDPIKNKIITTYDELFDRVAPSIQRAHLRVNSSLLVSEAKLAKTKN